MSGIVQAGVRRWMVAGPVTSLALTAFPAVPCAGQVLTPAQIAARARPAVVRVVALRDGEEVMYGSGVLVGPRGEFVTSLHVIQGAQSVRVHVPNGQVYTRVFFVAADEDRDLALLQIPGRGLPYLRVGDDRLLVVGDRIFVVGNPLGFDGTFSDGLVSGRRAVEGMTLLQVTAPISAGSSGGPVLNGRAEVVGIATLTVADGQNLNLAVPARYVHALLALAEDPIPFERAAARWAVAAGRGGEVAAEEEAQPVWLQVLAAELEEVDDVAQRAGQRRASKLATDIISKGQSQEVELVFPRLGDRIRVVGVCDVDCSDLDLAVYDPAGALLAYDIGEDDRPEASFEVRRPGVHRVVVHMAACRTAQCAFAVQAYRYPVPSR